MSAWSDARALAYTAPTEKLREYYEEACFALALVGRAIDGDDALDWAPGVDPEAYAVRVRELREERDAADEEKAEAEGRLEEKLQAEDADESLRELERLKEENEDLRARLEKVKPLLDAYADCLAVCRRFVGAAEEAKIPVKHCRIVSSKRSAGRRSR